MDKQAITQALMTAEPKSKAAKVRRLMPVIEQKIEEGVELQTILNTLNSQGLDLTMNTFKSILHRHRKAQGRGKAQSLEPQQQEPAALEPEAESAPGGAVSMGALHDLMNPDPAEQAAQLDQYERLGRRRKK
ncbi:hypothetical protein [Chromobacterium vaccinii]|uniref:hypothetical protein n=1 Tax=Chromobacterium vaccinii TaxID=1108595 RepID=UPI00345794E7